MTTTRNAEQQLRHAVPELLEERRQLLVDYCKLAGMPHAADDPHWRRRLAHFCQLLMDYASLWQFEIHDLLIKTQDHHRRAVEMLRKHQPAILAASDQALAFNDRYEAAAQGHDWSDFDDRLSRLGEGLASRFDAEDQVLAALDP